MADKYLFIDPATGDYAERAFLIISSGAGDSGHAVALDATGKLDPSLMPVGIAADTLTITASEAIGDGDFVNIFVSSGAKVRKADGSTTGKFAMGFVLASVSLGNPAVVYRSGTNGHRTGLTPGARYFLGTTAGGVLVAGSQPTAAGQTHQEIGVAASATELSFFPGPAIKLD